MQSPSFRVLVLVDGALAVPADRKLTQVFYLPCLISRQEIKEVITMGVSAGTADFSGDNGAIAVFGHLAAPAWFSVRVLPSLKAVLCLLQPVSRSAF